MKLGNKGKKIKEFGKKVIYGGPETQKRRAQQRADDEMMDDHAREFRLKGRAAGVRDRSFKEGYDQERYGAKKQGGFMGFMGRLNTGAQAFDKGAGSLIGDVDLSGMGQGLNTDFSGFGGFGGQDRSRPKTRTVHVHHYHDGPQRRRRRGR